MIRFSSLTRPLQEYGEFFLEKKHIIMLIPYLDISSINANSISKKFLFYSNRYFSYSQFFSSFSTNRKSKKSILFLPILKQTKNEYLIGSIEMMLSLFIQVSILKNSISMIKNQYCKYSQQSEFRFKIKNIIYHFQGLLMQNESIQLFEHSNNYPIKKSSFFMVKMIAKKMNSSKWENDSLIFSSIK